MLATHRLFRETLLKAKLSSPRRREARSTNELDSRRWRCIRFPHLSFVRLRGNDDLISVSLGDAYARSEHA